MPQIRDCKVATLNISATGNTTLVTPGTSPNNIGGTGVGSVFVWQVNGNAGAAINLQFLSGATNIGSPLVFGAAGTQALPYTGAPWFKGAAGQTLVVNASTIGPLTGEVYYTVE